MIRCKPRIGAPRCESASLSEAHPGDRLSIVSLRRWLDGPCGQAEVWNGLARTLGAGPAWRFLKAFERVLHEVAGSAGPRLERHASTCRCLGGDEALLAGMVRAADWGDSDTARALASGIVSEAELVAVVEAARLDQQMDNVGHGPVTGVEARGILH